MAAKHGRRYIGMDCAAQYCEIARERVKRVHDAPMMFAEGDMG